MLQIKRQVTRGTEVCIHHFEQYGVPMVSMGIPELVSNIAVDESFSFRCFTGKGHIQNHDFCIADLLENGFGYRRGAKNTLGVLIYCWSICFINAKSF